MLSSRWIREIYHLRGHNPICIVQHFPRRYCTILFRQNNRATRSKLWQKIRRINNIFRVFRRATKLISRSTEQHVSQWYEKKVFFLESQRREYERRIILNVPLSWLWLNHPKLVSSPRIFHFSCWFPNGPHDRAVGKVLAVKRQMKRWCYSLSRSSIVGATSIRGTFFCRQIKIRTGGEANVHRCPIKLNMAWLYER